VIVADGTSVIVMDASRGRPAKSWIAADILRIVDGVLVEHWDVLGRASQADPRAVYRCSEAVSPSDAGTNHITVRGELRPGQRDARANSA